MSRVRPFGPVPLEEWLRNHYFDCPIDIGNSGVAAWSMAELRRLAGIGTDELDEILIDDSPTAGCEPLREAIARRIGVPGADWVLAAHGSSEAIFLVMAGLLSAGDEVVVAQPGYPQLSTVAEAVGGRLRAWPLRFEDGYAPDLDELAARVGRRTRMVVVNFPHNPTGATLEPAGLDRLLEVVDTVGAYLVWDAAFAELTYDRPPLPDPVLRYPRCLSLGTLSKAYGLPGLRVGWCAARPEVVDRLVGVRDHLTLCLSPLVEHLARRVLEHGDRFVVPRLREAAGNRALLDRWISERPESIAWSKPVGGVACFPRLHGVEDTTEFCRRLAEEQSVLLVPGTCFGDPAHVRLGFSCPPEVLERGLDGLDRMLEEGPDRSSQRPGGDDPAWVDASGGAVEKRA